jgi:DNA-binding MurR/RpiR family transcriptional regulator
MLAEDGGDACLVLYEMRRYTKYSFQLARMASETGANVVIICDNHCYWARDYSDMVLSVRTDSHLFWDLQTPFLSLNGLLLDDLIAHMGDSVAERIGVMRRLQDSFEAFRD